MSKKLFGLLLILCASLSAGPIVQMHYQGRLVADASTDRGDTVGSFFIFDVNGVQMLTLCDQFNPEITTEPYKAMVATLDDLTGTFLQLSGDPQALQKYQQVGILALQAFLNPAVAPDVVWAQRYIVEGTGRLTDGARNLLDWVQTQDAVNYPQLQQFVIFAPVKLPGFILDTQEQVGFIPEPATVALMGGGLVGMMLFRRVRAKARQN